MPIKAAVLNAKNHQRSTEVTALAKYPQNIVKPVNKAISAFTADDFFVMKDNSSVSMLQLAI